jgi:hypothetical protein
MRKQGEMTPTVTPAIGLVSLLESKDKDWHPGLCPCKLRGSKFHFRLDFCNPGVESGFVGLFSVHARTSSPDVEAQ